MQVVDEFRDMVPMMKKGDVKGVFNAIIGNPSLLNAINVRAPHPFCRAGNTKVLQPGSVSPVLKKYSSFPAGNACIIHWLEMSMLMSFVGQAVHDGAHHGWSAVDRGRHAAGQGAMREAGGGGLGLGGRFPRRRDGGGGHQELA
eukprot:1078984-Rhodomonas_salina.1